MTQADDTAAPFEVGDRESISHKVTQGEILSFAELSGDDNPMHVDEAYVSSRGYRGLVSHGILTAALVSRVIGTRLPGRGALWTSQDLEFSGVVHPGDVITAEVEVKRVVAKDNLLILEAEVRNQSGDVVLRGQGRVHYTKTQPAPSEPQPRKAPKRALVLGASGSIGRAICAALLADGFECLAVFRDSPDALERMRQDVPADQGNKLRPLLADLTTTAGRAALLKQLGATDAHPLIVVSAASATPRNCPVESLGFESFERALAIDLLPLVELVRFLAPAMKERKFGRIVAIGSTAAVGRPDFGWAPYSTAKAALGAYIKSVALELGAAGVTANLVVPGMTATGMTASLANRFKTIAIADTPTRQLTRPEQVGEMVRYLCSPEGASISGQRLVIDGGREMQW